MLWAGEGAVASHSTAAAMWEIARWPVGSVHVTSARGLTSPPPGLCAHTTRLHPREQGSLRGIPVTSPLRTVVDVAATMGESELFTCVERAALRDLVSPRHLSEAVERYRGRRGVARLRKVLDLGVHDGRWASALEREVKALLGASGLPPCEREHPAGPYRIDFAWPGALVGIEADGRLWHSSRADFERDRAKHNALLAGGWQILRVTWSDLDEPDRVAARLRALLET